MRSGASRSWARGIGAAPLAVALALAIGGCGDDDDDGPTATDAPRTVAADDIAEFAQGTPERAVLEWWRHVQFRNAEGAHDLYSDDAEVTPEDLGRQITYAASSFVGVPEVVDVDKDGDLATVYMTLQAPESDAAPRPLSANLREEGGEWLLRDDFLMEQQVARVARARAVAEGE
jgi:hypothetical protein